MPLMPGQVLASPGSIDAYVTCMAWVYLCTRFEGGTWTPIFDGHTCPLSFWMSNITGSLALPDGQVMALSGEIVALKVELSVPIALERGIRFAVREGGRVIGFGIVTELV